MALAVGLAAGCGPDEVVPARGLDAAAAVVDARVDATIDAASTAWTVFVIVLENHDYDEIIGSADAPYINALLPEAVLATDYHETGSRSQPNYLHLVSGANQYPGTINTLPTEAPFPVDEPDLGAALTAGGLWWRTYQQSMGMPCRLTNAGRYVVRHNPFVYFAALQEDHDACVEHVVDLGALADDLAANRPRLAWLQPDLIDGGHDPAADPPAALRASDAWLAATLPTVRASAGYANGGVVLLTWDEAVGRDGRSETRVPLVMLSPRLRAPGTTVDEPLDHGALLATVLDVLGLARLPAVATRPSLAVELEPP
ncbi:MAG: alkaline phosphatase family protein [Kofleriaceae bacterium]